MTVDLNDGRYYHWLKLHKVKFSKVTERSKLDNSIGLHIYAVTQYRNRKPKSIPFSSQGDGSRLSRAMPHFVARYSSAEDESSEFPRPWFLKPAPSNGHTFEGSIMYGSTGYATDIIDRKTRETNYNRQVSDIEIFPLYYRMWVPDNGDYALLGLQTFGQKSCVGRFQNALESGFRQTNSGFRINFAAVAPGEIASYQAAEVKKLSLTKRDYSSDAAENQLGDPGALVDLGVTFSAKRKSHLGNLKSFTKRVTAAAVGNVLEYNDTHFDEATAEILVGGKRRTITLVGISRNTGKFDLSDDVARGANGMPKFESISSETANIFSDIATGKA